MPRPRVSIVIVTWNALPLLQQCFPSVVATVYPDLEIIVADNASEDGSAQWIEQTYADDERVRIVRHPENWKFCRGNNEAIPHTTGEYVCLLNNDVEVPPDWLGPLVAAMEADDRIAAVQPKLLQYDARDQFEYAGASGGFLDRDGYPFTRGRLFSHLEPDTGQYDDARDVFWATGAALLLRRSALDAVGLLDERFEMHMEEIDLCWRLWRAGYRVRVEPASAVYHIGGASLPQGDARKAYYNFRNNLLMLHKNLPPRVWTRVFARRLALDTAAAARTAATGNLAEARAIARAYADAHRLAKAHPDGRPRLGDPVVLPSYRRSIVVDHFARGIERFQDLPSDAFQTPAP